jgi:hypothetical protein
MQEIESAHQIRLELATMNHRIQETSLQQELGTLEPLG